jgi:hypothetical protein
MDAESTVHKVLSGAIERILRPLFRVLLRNQFSFNAFSDIAKRVYLEVASREFGIPGKKQTVSRVSILSGLTRKEVHRVLNLIPSIDSESVERYNRAARVVAGWVRDPDFGDASGNPVALAPQRGPVSFASLVRRHSGDVPARAVLDELLRVGAVDTLPDGRVRLLARAYVPRGSERDKLNILGTDVADLITTIDHNLQLGGHDPLFQPKVMLGGRDPLFQRKVMYNNLPAEALPEFRDHSSEQAQALLERLDRWLAEHDRDTNPRVTGTGRLRAGVGIYYFEEQLAPRPA